MKIIPLLFIVMLIFSGCGVREPNYQKRYVDSTTWIKKTIADMVDAIDSENKVSFTGIFSKNVRAKDEAFVGKVDDFYNFIQGEVESYNVLPGMSASKKRDYEKMMREVYATFCLVTTENTYYIAIKECIIDSWDADNEGVVSLHIINAKDWQTQIIYRGDGMWTEGIHIRN